MQAEAELRDRHLENRVADGDIREHLLGLHSPTRGQEQGVSRSVREAARQRGHVGARTRAGRAGRQAPKLTQGRVSHTIGCHVLDF